MADDLEAFMRLVAQQWMAVLPPDPGPDNGFKLISLAKYDRLYLRPTKKKLRRLARRRSMP